jgi:sugar O-acyltransferase (sialic acid O-acetyltransferase NeuD family)
MKEILLIGGGGHCRSVIDVIEQENKFKIAGIIEKFAGESQPVLGYELIGTDDDLATLKQRYDYAIITIGQLGSSALRVKLFNKLKTLGFQLPVIISPLAYVSPHAYIEEGSVVMHHALVNAQAHIKANCIINSKALLEHDVIVEEHCHISTNATLNGGVHVRAHTFVGSGVTTKQGAILKGFIKAGSIVK